MESYDFLNYAMGCVIILAALALTANTVHQIIVRHKRYRDLD